MPLLELSPYLSEQIFIFLEQFESGLGYSAHSDVVEALYSWGGGLIVQQHRRSSFDRLPAIPFSLIKQLHLALCAFSAVLPPFYTRHTIAPFPLTKF